MNYYQFHIGDFRSATGHLTRMQRALYRELLDFYYDKELPFSAGEIEQERLAHKLGCKTLDEKQDLDAVLDEFFPVAADGARHNERADIEIAKFHDFIEKGRKGGINSGRSRRAHSEATAKGGSTPLEGGFKPPSTPLEAPLNQPLPTTQQPLPTTHKPTTENSASNEAAVVSKPPALVSKELSAGETPAPSEKVHRPSKKAPKDFAPTELMIQWANDELHVSPTYIQRETEKFKDHTFGRAITDWPGAWRNWMRNSLAFGKSINRTAQREEQNLDSAERFLRGEG